MRVKSRAGAATAMAAVMASSAFADFRLSPRATHGLDSYVIATESWGETMPHPAAAAGINELVIRELLSGAAECADDGPTRSESSLADQEEWNEMKRDLLPVTLAKHYGSIASVKATFIDHPDGVHVYVFLDSEESDFGVMRQLAAVELKTCALLDQPVDFQYIPSRYVDPATIVPLSATRCYMRA